MPFFPLNDIFSGIDSTCFFFSSKDGAIQSLVIFRVDNSVEFPGGWEDEEEDEL